MANQQLQKSDVEKTNAFEQLSPVQKRLILNKGNFELIKNGFNVANHKGLKYWDDTFNPSPNVLSIVRELRYKTTDTLPAAGEPVIFCYNKTIKVQDKLHTIFVHNVGYFTGSGFSSQMKTHSIRQVHGWQTY